MVYEFQKVHIKPSQIGRNLKILFHSLGLVEFAKKL